MTTACPCIWMHGWGEYGGPGLGRGTGETHKGHTHAHTPKKIENQIHEGKVFAATSGMTVPVIQVKYIIAQESSPRSLHTQKTHAICKAIFAPILGCNGHCYKKKDQVKG